MKERQPRPGVGGRDWTELDCALTNHNIRASEDTGSSDFIRGSVVLWKRLSNQSVSRYVEAGRALTDPR